MLSGEEPKTVIIKKGEKMERYGKKQWKDKGKKNRGLQKRLEARIKRLRLAGSHIS